MTEKIYIFPGKVVLAGCMNGRDIVQYQYMSKIEKH